MLAQGRFTEEVAKVTGYCRNSIYGLVRRYNAHGVDGLKDKRHEHPGGQPMLSEIQQAQLLQALRTPPADGGLSHILHLEILMSKPQLRARGINRSMSSKRRDTTI